MDAFDMAAQQFRMQQGRAPTAAPGDYQSGDTTLMVADPNAIQPEPQVLDPSTKVSIDNQGVHYGGDPFEQEAARFNMKQAMARGENLVPYIEQMIKVGVPAANVESPAQAAQRGDPAAIAQAQRLQADLTPTTTIGGPDAINPSQTVPQQVDRATWEKIRNAYMVKYPTLPLPPELQVFQLGLQSDQVRQWALNTTDTPLQHDQGLIDQAKQQFYQDHPNGQQSVREYMPDTGEVETRQRTAALPEVLQGTAEERSQAKFNAEVQRLRQVYGSQVGEMTDEQVAAFHLANEEKDAKALVIGAMRKVVGNAPASDQELFQLAQARPELFRQAMAQAFGPKLLQAAHERQAGRELIGSIAGDTQAQRQGDTAAMQAELAGKMGQEASQRLGGVGPNLGEAEQFLHSFTFGLDSLIGHVGDVLNPGHGYSKTHEALLEGYAQQHPASAMVAGVLGMMMPGPAQYALGKTTARFLGTPLREGIAAAAAGGEAAQASILGKWAASAVANGVEMPIITAGQHVIEGNWEAAAKSIDMSDPNARLSTVLGAVGGATLHVGLQKLGEALVARPMEAIAKWAQGRSVDQALSDLNLGEADTARLQKLGRIWSEWQAKGGDMPAELRDLDVGTYQSLLRAAAAARAQANAPQTKTVQSNVVGEAAYRSTSGPEGSPGTAAEAPRAPEAATAPPEPPAGPKEGPPGEMGPKLDQLARAKAILDQIAPRGPDGQRRIVGGQWAEARKAVEDSGILVKEAQTVLAQHAAIAKGIKELDLRLTEQNRQAEAARQQVYDRNQPQENRRPPAIPEGLGEPEWKPKLGSITAAKARAKAAGYTDLGRVQQLPLNQILDPGQPNLANARAFSRKLAPGLESQADAVPPILVRKMAGGGYQVLDGADQFSAAWQHGFKQVPVIVAEGAAPKGEPPAPQPEAKRSQQLHPPRFASIDEVADWYGSKVHPEESQASKDAIKTFGMFDQANQGAFVLADVPIDQVQSTDLMGGGEGDKVYPATVAKYRNMTPEERFSKAPPAILVAMGEDLVVADGRHRLQGFKEAGAKTIRAYVPEKFLGTKGIQGVGVKSNAAHQIAPGEGTASPAEPDLLQATFEDVGELPRQGEEPPPPPRQAKPGAARQGELEAIARNKAAILEAPVYITDAGEVTPIKPKEGQFTTVLPPGGSNAIQEPGPSTGGLRNARVRGNDQPEGVVGENQLEEPAEESAQQGTAQEEVEGNRSGESATVPPQKGGAHGKRQETAVEADHETPGGQSPGQEGSEEGRRQGLLSGKGAGASGGKASRGAAPALPPLEHARGNPTTIQTTTGAVPAHYAIVEADHLIPSHNPATFKPSEGYPKDVNERDYQHDKEEKQKVFEQINTFNPSFLLTDDPTPVNGPPMVLANGLVMGGNSRVMTVQSIYMRQYELRDIKPGKLRPEANTFRKLVIDEAQRFGVDRAAAVQMQHPVLVRILDEQTTDPARMRELVRQLQKGFTQELSGAMDAASRARILMDNPEGLARLQQILGEEDSIREILAKPSKVAAIRDWLTFAGVMSKVEAARYFDNQRGMFNEDGKRLIERILQAVIVPDVALFDNLPAQTSNKVTGNLYGLVYPKTKGPEWDIAPLVHQALEGYYRWRASEAPLDDFLKGMDAGGQTVMVPDPLSFPENARAATILRRLATDNTVAWRERVKAYLDHARRVVPGEQIFVFAEHTKAEPTKAFKDSFERDIPLDLSGKPVGKAPSGGLFGMGPEKYHQAIDGLRRALTNPSAIRLRKLIDFSAIPDGHAADLALMAASGGLEIDPARMMADPELAERIARVATFHLEQFSDQGAKMLPKWAAAVRQDLGSILRDLGYAIDEGKFVDLLEQLWKQLGDDPDVQDALGKLPEFKKDVANGGSRRAAQRGKRAGASGATGSGTAGGPQAPGGELGGSTGPGQPGGAPVVPGDETAAPGGPGEGDQFPQWLPVAQREDYLAASGSDRVSPYVPLEPTRAGYAHPRLLVESKALAGIQAGDVGAYEVDPRAIVNVSDAQRDQIQQAGYRIHFENAGMLIADDVGVGKSRIIGGIIADQVGRELGGLTGKKRILVLTKNRQNVSDLIQTFKAEQAQTFQHLLKEGLTFTHVPDEGAVAKASGKPQVQLVDAFNLARYAGDLKQWKPDLVIVDEAHLFSNLAGETERANVLEGLYADLVHGQDQPAPVHFLYLTATPASDIAALQFMYGLKLWAPKSVVEARKTDLPTFDGWLQRATGVSKIGSWRESIATPIIEQLMRELKMQNAYASLDFWRGGFQFSTREAQVSAKDLETFDALATILNQAIKLYVGFRPQVNHSAWPKADENGNPTDKLSSPMRPDGQALFFMKRLLVNLRLDAAIDEAKEALARGDQVVFKLLGVSDTQLTGEAGNLGAALDAIPQFRAIKNKKGEIERWEPIRDAQVAVQALRNMAKQTASGLSLESPLKRLVEEFGGANVAQIVGATPQAERLQHNADFQAGRRKVAIISAAGESGINLQDLGTGRRWLIYLDLDWDSKAFKQSLGRVDRANQLTTPGATTISTPIAGERRFHAGLAVRMKSLGAISKGQEDAAGTDALNDFDMESSTWNRAINETVHGLPKIERDRLLHGDKDELSWREFQNDLLLVSHKLGNKIYEAAERRWRELEEEDRAGIGDKLARRNRGLIRQTTDLDEGDWPLQIHQVENITGETYGIVSGALLTRPESAINFKAIQAAAKVPGRAASSMFITMQQGERIVSGLYVPRGKIETIKALFGKADQKHLFGPNGAASLPDQVIDKLPPRYQLLATRGIVPLHLVAPAQPKGKLISRQALTDAVIQKLGVTVAVGKQALLRKKALGYYKPMHRLIRQKTANDIAVLAHEAGHALDDLFTELQPPQQFDHELLPLGVRTSGKGYTKRQIRMEGVAEWFRIYLLDPKQAYALAPDYAAWWEKKAMEYPAIWNGVKELQAMYDQYLAQDPVEQLQSQIDFDDEGPTMRSRRAKETRFRYLYRHLFDNFAPLDWARRDLNLGDLRDPNGKPLPDGDFMPDQYSEDAYVLARLNAGNRELVRGWVKYGVRDRDGNIVAKGLEPILRENGISGQRLRDFEAYLVAQRALELYGQEAQGKRQLKKVFDVWGGSLGVTFEQAEATVRRFGSPTFSQAALGVYRWNEAVLDHWMRSSGSFSGDQLDRIMQMNQFYIPFHRVMDYAEAARGAGPSLVDKGRIFHRVFGSGRRIRRPLATLIRNTVRMVENVEQNRAALMAFKMLAQTPGGGEYADKVLRPVRPTSGQLKEIKKALIAAGVDPKDMEEQNGQPAKIDLETVWTVWRPVRHNPKDLEVALRMRGKTVIWQVHVPALYEALTGHFSAPTNNLLLRVLMAGTNLARAGFTLGLDFSIGSNLPRDQQTAFIQSRYGYKPWTDFWKGLMAILTQSKTYQLFLQAKAGSAGKVGTYSDAIEHEIRQIGKSKLRRALSILSPRNWLDILEAISRASDNATRVGEFARGLEAEGITAEGLARAGLAGRDVTVDFWRGGQWSRQIGQWRAFFGAQMQGPDTAVRAMKRDPLGFLVRAIGSMTLLALLLHYLSRDNPDYQERKLERSLYFLIPLGNPKTTRKWLRIRKPNELGTVFANAGESIFESILAKDPAELKRWIPDDKTAMAILMDLMPTAVVPLLEASFNYDTFRQRPIVGDEASKLEPSMQFNRYTTETSKLIGQVLNMSPAKIDHVLYGYTGTLGQQAMAVGERWGLAKLYGITGKSEPPTLGGFEQDIPGFRKFFSRDLSPNAADSVIQLYGLMDRLDTVERTLQAKMHRGDGSADAYRQENAQILAQKGQLQAARGQMKLLRDQINQVYDDAKLSPEQKREQLRDLGTQMVNVARSVLNRRALEPSR